ncbi:response regulator [Oceanicaulis sp. MMSF_3324]|uniref:response regulator n=1 Tax=Oceanicaulis sp. MMSF_3324 TaxID=3046702 RepID=UPI00273EFC74|nr:response regulator [Oceanicaulis sp. MMSF_3324]
MKLERIACVEDDLDIRTILEMSLSEVGGFSVELYEDGPSALAALTGEPPQLIMLDMMMPGMNGLEVLKALRRRPEYQDTPVVFMTAKAQSHELDTYIEAGAQTVIVKPFDPMTLPNEILKIWDSLEK